VTQHMQVPISFADAVIGAAGANISYIRRASGATVTIQETRGVPGEMTVEINGSATQVQTAQQLIQACLASFFSLEFAVLVLILHASFDLFIGITSCKLLSSVIHVRWPSRNDN